VSSECPAIYRLDSLSYSQGLQTHLSRIGLFVRWASQRLRRFTRLLANISNPYRSLPAVCPCDTAGPSSGLSIVPRGSRTLSSESILSEDILRKQDLASACLMKGQFLSRPFTRGCVETCPPVKEPLPIMGAVTIGQCLKSRHFDGSLTHWWSLRFRRKGFSQRCPQKLGMEHFDAEENVHNK
jgi:hypothetical protein